MFAADFTTCNIACGNRRNPGHRRDTGSPGHDIAHSGTAGRLAPSASFADERWKDRGFTATLPLLCTRTVGGVASVVTSNQARRYALLFGLALLPLFARFVSQMWPGHRPVLHSVRRLRSSNGKHRLDRVRGK